MKLRENVYCMDSSALITINRYYPKTVFPDLWAHLEDLFRNIKIYSHEMVYDELVPASGPSDEIGRLISRHKSSFKAITNRQGQLALQILSNFPKLIDPRAKRDQADPWIIALVIEKMEQENLFGQNSAYIIVSAESEKSESKIPAVCKHYQIRHFNLFQFFEDNGWEFSVRKKNQT
mgnify:CR=1 FL=1